MRNFLNKRILFTGKVILTGLIFWALAHNSQLKLELLHTLLENPLHIILILLLCYLMIFFNALRWNLLNLAQNINLSLLQTIKPTYIGVAFNTILPGSVGGDFVRMFYILKRFPNQKSAAALSIFFDRFIALVSIVFMACILSPYFFKLGRRSDTLENLLVFCLCASAIIIISFLLIYLLVSTKNRIIFSMHEKVKLGSLAKYFTPLFSAIKKYKDAKLTIFNCITISIITQLILLIAVIVIIKIMKLPMLSFFDLMIALILAQIANLIPLTPGGIGIGEAAFANILILLNPGITTAYATIFFALRLVSIIAYFPGVIIGIFDSNLISRKNNSIVDQA